MFVCTMFFYVLFIKKKKSFHSHKTKSISALTMKFSKWGKQFLKNNVFLERLMKIVLDLQPVIHTQPVIFM